MLIVLANWLFIVALCSAWGFPLYRLLRKWTPPEAPEATLTQLVLLGLLSLTTICNLCSLWLPIGMEVCLFLSIGAAFLAFIHHQAWAVFLKKQREMLRSGHWLTAVYFLLLLAIALIKTIGVSEIEDEAAYHLPLIRWIEHYPVVPGIANIEDRLGFNPAIYMANALFGVGWLFKGGLYDLNSFLFVLIGGSFLRGFGQLLIGAKVHLLSGMIQATALVFLFRAYLTTMDADFLNIYGVLYFLVFLIRQIEQNRFGQPDWQTVWSLLFFCFLVTNKFSAALMAPIAFFLVYALILQKQGRILLITLAFTSTIVLSWVARNYYLSGFVVYPVYFLDLFSVDWKTPYELVAGQYYYVSEYAKTEITRPFNTYVTWQPALWEWLPHWFQFTWAKQIGKVFFVGMGGCMILWVHFIFSKKKHREQSLWLLALLLFIVILVWFWRIPALRFGWPWVLVFMCITVFLSFEFWLHRHITLVKTSLAILLAASLFRSTSASIQEGFDPKNHWLYPAQVQYPAVYTTQYFNKIKVQIAPDDYCRDAVPPCFPKHYHPGLRARGKTVEEGFRIEEPLDSGRGLERAH